MAWTAPMTAVANEIWTSAHFNTHIRDNLNETMPGKATAANRIYVTTAANAIAERVPSGAAVATSQTTTSTSFTDLTTVGPAVTVTTGTTAIVWVNCEFENNTANAMSAASPAVSGATTVAAGDKHAARSSGAAASNPNRFAACHRFIGLTAGSNTFTMKYRVDAGTGTFLNREIVVLPL